MTTIRQYLLRHPNLATVADGRVQANILFLTRLIDGRIDINVILEYQFIIPVVLSHLKSFLLFPITNLFFGMQIIYLTVLLYE